VDHHRLHAAPNRCAAEGKGLWKCRPQRHWHELITGSLPRQWRFRFPRGTDLGGVEPTYAKHVASIVNGQCRRSLDYQSPAALYPAVTTQ
jgi:IS30 family transposase